MTPARIVLHLPDSYLETFRTRKHLLYNRIEDVVGPKGGTVEVRGRPTGRPAADSDLHIVDNGRFQRQGYLNSCTAYFEGFWHLDPVGVLAESRTGARIYDPAQIDTVAADRFFAQIHARFAATRRSRYRQARAVVAVPQDAIAVFLQGPSPMKLGHAHCSVEDMLRAVAQAAGGRAVVVKPHPLQQAMGQTQIAEAQAQGHDLTETNANVHDILARASVTVSINSAAALEGFQHGKPAILFGKSDFHHHVQTVRHPDDFASALQAALASKTDYAKALYWYFGLNCLWLEASDFEARLLGILAEAGFDADRLGLQI